MNISELKFTATQCLYTLVLNNPQNPKYNTHKLIDYCSLDKKFKLNARIADDFIKASYDLAEMMLKEGEKREKINDNSPYATEFIKQLDEKIKYHRANQNDSNNLSLPIMATLHEVKDAVEKCINKS